MVAMATIQDLKNIMKNTKNRIEKLVLEDAIACGDEAIIYLKNVVRNGCVSGTVSRLNYNDTHKFFDEYYDEITEAVEEHELWFGEKPQYKGDMKNWFAWFAYEWNALKVLNKLKVQY
jgi:hypothetical protein